MREMKLILVVMFSLLGFSFLRAQTTTTQASGLWSDPATWDNGIPNSTVNVGIGFFDRLTVDINGQCNNVTTSASSITINPGVTLTVFGEMSLAVFASNINNGTLVLLGSLVSNTGGSSLTINGGVTSVGGIELSESSIE